MRNVSCKNSFSAGADSAAAVPPMTRCSTAPRATPPYPEGGCATAIQASGTLKRCTKAGAHAIIAIVSVGADVVTKSQTDSAAPRSKPWPPQYASQNQRLSRRRNDSSSLISEQSSAAFSKPRGSTDSVSLPAWQLACAAWRFTYFYNQDQMTHAVPNSFKYNILRLNW